MDVQVDGPDDEVVKLKAAVQTHGDKDWIALPRWSRVEQNSVG
jgi:hypothetical protein